MIYTQLIGRSDEKEGDGNNEEVKAKPLVNKRLTLEEEKVRETPEALGPQRYLTDFDQVVAVGVPGAIKRTEGGASNDQSRAAANQVAAVPNLNVNQVLLDVIQERVIEAGPDFQLYVPKQQDEALRQFINNLKIKSITPSKLHGPSTTASSPSYNGSLLETSYRISSPSTLTLSLPLSDSADPLFKLTSLLKSIHLSCKASESTISQSK